jgi:hypothetical protein
MDDLTLNLALGSERPATRWLPHLLSRSFAGETREGAQAVIYQQPASTVSASVLSSKFVH